MAKPQVKQAGREQWSGQFGFIIAAIGSAVGLGNIWRFPGVAYENGGGAFLIPYVVALLTAGIPILLLDYALGHRFRGSAPAVFRRISRRFEPLGWFQVGICCVISLYYTVIIAWSAKYVFFSLNTSWGEDTGKFLEEEFLHVAPAGVSLDFVAAVFWPLLIIWALTIAILALGIQKGVERANMVFLPVLVILFVVLVVRAVFLPGALEGLNAFFTPDFSALGDPGVWIAAYSQIFFSLSIAFGIMITYSSYLRLKTNLTPTAFVVGFANSSFEILAGIGVFATLGFMASTQGIGIGELENIKGVSLAFVAFPQVISMMPGGPIFGVLFFTSLALAGFTSLLSILQVISAAIQEKFGLSPRRSALSLGIPLAVVSILLFSTTTGLPVLDTVDNYINEIGIVSSAILTCVLVMWVSGRSRELQWHLNSVSSLRLAAWWRLVVTFFVPVVLTYMLVSQIIELLTKNFSGYPTWFLTTVGWGVVGLVVIAAGAATALKWRQQVDDFSPEPDFPGRSSERSSS